VFALLLTPHLTPPQLRRPTPHLQLASFRAPTLREVINLQLPPPVVDKVDAYKGTLRAGEVGVGIGGALGTTRVTGTFAAIVGLGIGAAVGGGPLGLVGGYFVALVVGAVLQLGLLPPLVALLEHAFADAPLAGSLGRAVGYAYAGEGVALAVAILGGLLFQSNQVARVAIAIAVGGMELIGVPMLASLGLHGGDHARGPGDAAPEVVSPPGAMPPQLAPPPPSGPSNLPALPPTALNFSFRF
jgi:hypothetical protein